MTINQIRYFIALANCLNFTKAADQLYISQSALSRQISTMEAELNLQLFVRTQRFVKLTPAGKALLDDLSGINDQYTEAINRAKDVQLGLSGLLHIGILDGTRVDDLLPPVIAYFSKKYPNVDLSLRNHSFNRLVEGLYDGTLDLAITLLFDIQGRQNLKYRVIEKTRDHIVVHKDHRLAGETTITFSDIKDDTFIIVAHEDSYTSGKLILDACKREGFVPNVKYSPSIQTSMLWVQSGMGVAMFDTRNTLYESPNVRFLDVDSVSDPSLTIVWSQDNHNPYRERFVKLLFDLRDASPNETVRTKPHSTT